MGTLGVLGGRVLPRALHPAAWWGWALGLATAAARTTNPILLGLIIAVAGLVVAARRTEAPWALAFRMYLMVAAFVVVLRVAFRVLFNGNGSTILFTLPTIHLPAAAAGVQLLGPVSLEALVAAFYEGLRLATMIVCIGAANALANPKRLLAAVPGALYEIGTVVAVALSMFPQLAESVQRIKRARMLRASTRTRRGWLREVVMPTVADALDRSLLLAAAMDSRGYGRQRHIPLVQRRLNSAAMVIALLALSVGVYSVLDASTPWYLGLPLLGAGMLLGVGVMALSGRRAIRSRYRPDPWRLPESLVLGSGALAALGITLAGLAQPDVTFPSVAPLVWPAVSLLALASILVAALPAVLAPPPPDLAGEGLNVDVAEVAPR